MKHLMFFIATVIFFQITWCQIPSGYYSALNNMSGNQLQQVLNTVIKGHTVYPYNSNSTDVFDILKETDEDPTNSDNVILLYTGRSQKKNYLDSGYQTDYSQFDGGDGSFGNAWNREHVWPSSYGFGSDEDVAHSDVHHIRPADRSVNSSRGNKYFDNGGEYHTEATLCKTDVDSWEPRDAVKGDIARMLFYMEVRYENNTEYDLELEDVIGSSTSVFGKLSTLLVWHSEDPVDDFERNRNEVIYGYQGNRNPFIDHPELVDHIWGTQQNTPWKSSFTTTQIKRSTTLLYPNPTTNGLIFINSPSWFLKVRIVSISGKLLFESPLKSTQKTIQLPKKTGVYFIILTDNNELQSTHKVVVSF